MANAAKTTGKNDKTTKRPTTGGISLDERNKLNSKIVRKKTVEAPKAKAKAAAKPAAAAKKAKLSASEKPKATKPAVKPAAAKATAKKPAAKKTAPVTAPAPAPVADVVKAPAVIGRPIEIPGKKRVTVDVTEEIVKLTLGLSNEKLGLEAGKKKSLSPYFRKAIIAQLEADGVVVKVKC